MLCSRCKKKEANVHFSGVVNGKSIKLELCEDCARTSGVNAPIIEAALGGLITSPFSFASAAQPAFSELMDLLANWHKSPTGSHYSKSHCPVCHWTLDGFQKTGKMGCAECYTHFHKEASGLLRKIYGGQILHKGKKAPGETAREKVNKKKETLEQLRSNLEKAVREEKFEVAATLRDKIIEFEQKENDANL